MKVLTRYDEHLIDASLLVQLCCLLYDSKSSKENFYLIRCNSVKSEAIQVLIKSLFKTLVMAFPQFKRVLIPGLLSLAARR